MKLWMYYATVITTAIMFGTAHAQDHAFTVKDDIAMTRFSNPLSLPGIAGSEVARCSPDGKHCVIVTTKGLLNTDEVESTLSIFRIEDARSFLNSPTSTNAPRPHVIATIVSFPHHEEPDAYAAVIKDLHWSADSTHIYFKGESANGAYRLHVVAIDGNGLRTLTPADYSVSQYDVVGNTIVYTATRLGELHVASGDLINKDAKAVTGYRLMDVLFPGGLADVLTSKTFTLWVMKERNGQYVTAQVPNYSIKDQDFLFFKFPFALSPKGDRLIELMPVTTVPRSWEAYEPARGFEYLRYRSDDPRLTSETNMYRPRRYISIDLTSGKQTPLVNAPNGSSLIYGDNNRVAWSNDERRVLLTNTFLPVGQIVQEAPSPQTSPCAVTSVDIRSGGIHCVMPETNEVASDKADTHVEEVSFGPDSDEIELLAKKGDGKQQVQKYRFSDGGWKLTTLGPDNPVLTTSEAAMGEKLAHGGDLQFVVKQSLNEPPMLWVSNIRTKHSRMLWNPNPQFAHIQFGEVSIYRWKDQHGYEWTGGLIKPVGYVPGKRYPLVVQMYMFFEGEFMTDGTDPSAFAARHLASAGFVVLQIQKKMIHTHDDAEAQEHLEGYRSAIDHLSADGLVDAKKVGVVGFSGTTWYVENALVKAPNLFAAATIADGVDHSYMQYRFGEWSSILQNQEEKIIGAKPVGAGLNVWLERAVGFHLDQVQTPLRIEAINPWSLLEEWELYSSLRMQDKPVDLIYFPNGTHIHQRPLERLESQQGDVDWFRYWLQGYEDPDPAKLRQYKRWEMLRVSSHFDAKQLGQ